MSKFNFLKSIEYERNIRLKGRYMADPHAGFLWQQSISRIHLEKDKNKLLNTYKFARSIKYKHEGLSSDIYFAHPLRVSSLAMLYFEDINIDLGIIGLIHNLLELSEFDSKFIEDKFGKKISEQIISLTVDRSFQWDVEYKKSYYDRIERGPIEGIIVKIFDKLDNLFILGINQDNGIKIKYLSEIEKHVLPLALEYTPKIYNYMKKLVENNYNEGFNLN